MTFVAIDKSAPKDDVQPPVLFVYFLAFLCAVSGFLLGYDTGIVSAAMVYVREHFQLDDAWHEYIVSITIFSAAVCAMLAGYVTDWCGRKPVVIFSGLIFTPGALICGLAVDKIMLFFGRLILGIGIGVSSMIVPIYIAEVAPVSIRGTLVVTNLTFIFFGEFLAGVIAAGLAQGIDPEYSWRWMLGIAAAPAVIQAFGFIFLPESPRWLVRNGKDEQAMKVLDKLRKGVGVEEEFVAIKVDCEENDKREAQESNKFIWLKILKDKNTRKALLVGCLLWIVHEFSGVNTIMYYCGTIIKMSGIYDNNKVLWLAAIPPAISAICSISAMFLIERLGRRPLLMFSLIGLVVGMIIVSIGFHFVEKDNKNLAFNLTNFEQNYPCLEYSTCFDCVKDKECGICFTVDDKIISGSCLPRGEGESEESLIGNCINGTAEPYWWEQDYCPTSNYKPTILIGLCIYLLFFSVGLGPVSWAANAEVFPLWARSTCQAFAMAVNYISNFVVSFTFLKMADTMTTYGTFYFYGGIALLGLIYFYFEMPETKGIALEDIDVLFLSKAERDKINADRAQVRHESIVTLRNSSVLSLRNRRSGFDFPATKEGNGLEVPSTKL